VIGPGRLDVRPGSLRARQLQGDGDDLEAEGVKLRTQCLPPGQVEGAALVGRPGDEHDLLPAQGREPELVAVDVAEHQVRSLGADQRPVTQ
jgi:hypothetical protein